MARFVYGQITVSASAQPLTTSHYELLAYTVKAPSTNVGITRVGDSAVTLGNGHFLEPGEDVVIDIEVREGEPRFEVQPHELYVVGTVGDKVSFFGSF